MFKYQSLINHKTNSNNQTANFKILFNVVFDSSFSKFVSKLIKLYLLKKLPLKANKTKSASNLFHFLQSKVLSCSQNEATLEANF